MTRPNKRVLFLIDGAADHADPHLNGKTPLQLAELPSFNRIAREGASGLVETIQPGMPNGSATANLGVMGYDARAIFGTREGRGILEAASMGVDVKPGQLAMRVNVIAMTPDGAIKNHSSGDITTPEAQELIAYLQENLKVPGVTLHPGIQYRHLLVLDGGDENVECAPPHDHVGESLESLLPKAETAAARRTAEILAEVVRKSQPLLRDHPVNRKRRAEGHDSADSLWPWAPGNKPKMQTFQERYGVSGAVVAAVDLIHGIGVLGGLEKVVVPTATGLWHTDYEAKAEAAIDALKRHDFVYMHVEGPDEAGHAKEPWLKLKCLEWTDTRIAARIMKACDAAGYSMTYAVLPDHPTPWRKGKHVTEPVPLSICGPHIAADSNGKYDEFSVKSGSLGLLRGPEFMDLFMGVRRHGT